MVWTVGHCSEAPRRQVSAPRQGGARRRAGRRDRRLTARFQAARPCGGWRVPPLPSLPSRGRSRGRGRGGEAEEARGGREAWGGGRGPPSRPRIGSNSPSSALPELPEPVELPAVPDRYNISKKPVSPGLEIPGAPAPPSSPSLHARRQRRRRTRHVPSSRSCFPTDGLSPFGPRASRFLVRSGAPAEEGHALTSRSLRAEASTRLRRRCTGGASSRGIRP